MSYNLICKMYVISSLQEEPRQMMVMYTTHGQILTKLMQNERAFCSHYLLYCCNLKYYTRKLMVEVGAHKKTRCLITWRNLTSPERLWLTCSTKLAQILLQLQDTLRRLSRNIGLVNGNISPQRYWQTV